MQPASHVGVLSDWFSVLCSSAERLLWCFVSLGGSGPLPWECITPRKTLQGQPGWLVLPRGLLAFIPPVLFAQGSSYKALTTKKQNLGLGRRVALACFLGLSDLWCCAVSGGRTPSPCFRGGGSRFGVQTPSETFSSPFFFS